MNGNKIGNKGGMSMAQMLQVNSTLKNLDIGDTDLVCFNFKNFLWKKHFFNLTAII